MNIHLGIKNFKCNCNECDKCYVTQHDLNLHISRNHDSSIKRFKCSYDECDKSF
jgi:hypothetical protein